MLSNKLGKITGKVVRSTADAPSRLKGKVAEARFAFSEGWNESNPKSEKVEEDIFDDLPV